MTPAPLLECIERPTGPAPAWSVLVLHGLGDSGHGFAGIEQGLVRPGWPAVRFVYPHAPERAITLNMGMRMRAWYDIVSLDRLGHEDEKGMRASVALVEALIAREESRGIASSNIVLAGFSQGGAIALAAGLRHPRPLAGIAALSSYLPLAASTAAEMRDGVRETPVFMAHGTFDPVIPEAYGRMSSERLRALGLKVAWHSYPMAHTLCDEEVAALSGWLGALLARP